MKWSIAAGILALVAVIGFAYYFAARPHAPMTPDTSSASSTSIAVNNNGVMISGGKATVSETPAENTPPAPDYHTPLVFSSAMDADAQAAYQHKFDAAVAGIDQDPKSFGDWINLGMIRKAVGDYAGAAVDWEYVTKLYPTSTTALNDLGDLYMNFTKDYAKAEQRWLASIKIKASDPAPYSNLFALYTTTSYHSSATAGEDILKKGIAANPDAIDLKLQLARYYKSLGRTADAKAQYDAAIAIAKAQGQSDLAAQITAEESSL